MSDVLTIGMATHGEFDSVWFTLRALIANHPRCQYLVVDNTPTVDVRTGAITRAVGGRYVHRPDLAGTSKPRDAVFAFADTPWVMCVDSHVILETGAVDAALSYIGRTPNSNDLIQGPMVSDDGKGFATHWETKAAPLFDGVWKADPRGADRFGEPFEIPMCGLGLWMMRRAAWPGFNPLFGGFGGEEGYLHEVVRQRGGKAVCVPAIRWGHKFRDISGWNNNPQPPYPLRLEDHTFNLLVGHRETGLECEPLVYEHFGKRLPSQTWAALVARAREQQPLGGPRPRVTPQRILAVWYSDNHAPEPLLQRSAESVVAAKRQTLRHDVTVSANSWRSVPGAPFAASGTGYRGAKRRGYDTLVAQVAQAVGDATATGGAFDAVAFCEHDVLYPPDYFDRIGDALAAHPAAPGVVNHDCVALNATGWLNLRRQDEPNHQCAMRWDAFRANLERCKAEAATGRPVVVEPADRAAWVRLAGRPNMPAVHVNHDGPRLSSHGADCYEPVGRTLFHPHWGPAEWWWPGRVTSAPAAPSGGCGACAAAAAVAPAAPLHKSLAAWYEAVKDAPPDFKEHMPTVRELASHCDSACEIVAWPKPCSVAVSSGLPASGRFTSYAPNGNPNWSGLAALMGDRFASRVGEPAGAVEPTDLLFVDTAHTAAALLPLLDRHHAAVKKYVVVHCTETFGEAGDRDNAPGVMHALRTFCKAHPEWVVKRRDRNNHGLMVLSKCPEDVKELPGLWRKAMNYAGAMARHTLAGSPVVSLAVLEERQGHCATCEERALDACAACGCPLESKLPLAGERCGLVKKGLKPKWDAVTDPADLKA